MKNIINEIELRGIKISIVPVEVLKDIKEDIIKLSESEELNGFQKWITNEAYVLELPDPEPDFTAKSIIITAAPFKLICGIFNHNGKKAEHIFDVEQNNVDIKAIFESHTIP